MEEKQDSFLGVGSKEECLIKLEEECSCRSLARCYILQNKIAKSKIYP